jgi:GGDEF domain-containing protein
MIEDEVFLCGLLTEIGQIVCAECLTEEYATVLEAAEGSWPTGELERELMGFSHADVGEALLTSWQFPKTISTVLRHVHAPDDLPEDLDEGLRKTVQVLALANDATDLLCGEDSTAALERLEERGQRLFGLTSATLDVLVEAMAPNVKETAEMLSVPLPPGKTMVEILAEARGIHLERTLGTARAKSSNAPPEVLEHLRQLASDLNRVDEASGLLDRRAFELHLSRQVELHLAGALETALGLLCIELDDLERLTRTEEPETVERLLGLVGQTLARLTSGEDGAFRLEGTRFAVVMTDSTPFGLRTLAERLRRGVAAQAVETPDGKVRTTLTSGGVCLGTVAAASDGPALLEAARRTLHRALSQRSNHSLVHGSFVRPPARRPRS